MGEEEALMSHLRLAPLTTGPSGKPLSPEPPMYNQTAGLSLSEGSAEGQSCSALEGKPHPWNLSPSSFPESQAFWRRATEFFPVKSHLPGEEGSLWIGNCPTPQHHPEKPQPPGSCRAAKLTYPSWYFESGSSHARPSKGWHCAFGPGVVEWRGW